MTAKKRRIGALLLTPGAGADRNQSALVAIDEGVSSDGIVVERIDFPYRKAGRKAPDRAPVLIASVVEAATDLAAQAGVAQDRVALGGRSMGGRMCSMAVAEGLPAAALVLVSYPLHPPGKPDKMRTEHSRASTCRACSCPAPGTPSARLTSSQQPREPSPAPSPTNGWRVDHTASAAPMLGSATWCGGGCRVRVRKTGGTAWLSG